MTRDRLLPVYLSVLFAHVGISLVAPFTSVWLRTDLGEPSFFILASVLALPNVISIAGIFLISHYTDKRGNFRYTILLINLVGSLQYLFLTQITQATSYLIIVGTGALVFPAYYTIIQAFATNICEKNERGKITGYLMLNASLGWFVGSAFSGNAYNGIGMNSMFIISTIVLLTSGLIILLAPSYTPKLNDDEISEIPSVMSILRRKQIYLLLLTIVIIDFSAGSFFVMGSIYFLERIGMQEEMIGYANALATIIGAIILRFMANYTDRRGRKKVYVLGLSLYPTLFLALSFLHNPWVVFALWGVPIYILLRPTAPAMISDLTSEVERSRGMSLVTISSTVSMTLGAIFGGYLVDVTGNMDLWTYIPAVVGWIAVFIGFKYVKETNPV